jgi:hypothetical protein
MNIPEWVTPDEARVLVKNIYGLEHTRRHVVDNMAPEDLKMGAAVRGEGKGEPRVAGVRFEAYLRTAQNLAAPEKGPDTRLILRRLVALEDLVYKLATGRERTQ